MYRLLGARLDRDRGGLLIFFVGVVLFRVAAAVNSRADLLVSAAPVVMLASGIAVTCEAPSASPSRTVVGQWGGAGGAICEDHFALAGRLWASRGDNTVGVPYPIKTGFHGRIYSYAIS